MYARLALFCSLALATVADRDGKRWVWEDNHRSESRHREADPRYEVFENSDLDYNQPPNRPFFGGGGGGGGGVKPLKPLAPNERPGGVYGGLDDLDAGYGELQSPSYYPEEVAGGAGILTGPVPSWMKEKPFKNFDKCKCTQRFNCPSPGISYGHCDVGKQYCCFTVDKNNHVGEPLPSRPVHSIENGILVGPGGPVDPVPGVNVNPRPPRPGGYPRPGHGAGFGLRPSFSAGNSYSAQNGILVGPGGPVDRPYG
ncbi:hypothetical protein NQ315_002306 [Exocentrus adspersus]|uniref:Uncharacterized protein n=1 Tax=Exocentrus adspersus TaxID=1586481 RepID=A0AAV8VSR3_9CUCU|nr:hypothetical protein NQ315_002306 [Exocentrus adspersus]